MTHDLDDWINEFLKFDPVKNVMIEKPVIHALKLQDKMISLDPPLELSKLYWY